MTLRTILPGACFLLLVGAAGCSASVTPPTSGSTCDPDDTVACAGGTGYSCTGSDSPDDADSTLLCSDGTPGNAGSTLYCCASFGTATTTCQQDSTVDSCEPPSIGFSCTGSDSPDQADSTLTCSAGVPGNAGSTLFCCQ